MRKGVERKGHVRLWRGRIAQMSGSIHFHVDRRVQYGKSVERRARRSRTALKALLSTAFVRRVCFSIHFARPATYVNSEGRYNYREEARQAIVDVVGGRRREGEGGRGREEETRTLLVRALEGLMPLEHNGVRKEELVAMIVASLSQPQPPALPSSLPTRLAYVVVN